MDIEARIREFAVKLEDYYNADQPDYLQQKVTIITGKKFTKIAIGYVKSEGRSVYCFIDQSNGDIYKAASWKAPAKGVRGSIFNDNCDVGDDKPCNRFGSGLYR